jgi:hypothetical protein
MSKCRASVIVRLRKNVIMPFRKLLFHRECTDCNANFVLASTFGPHKPPERVEEERALCGLTFIRNRTEKKTILTSSDEGTVRDVQKNGRHICLKS